MMKFTELPLSAPLQQKLADNNFETTTPIQEAAIPFGLAGRDLMATAQTGTGKTLAFLIPIIEELSKCPAPGIQALVLVPTRELAMQVAEQYDMIRSRKLAPAAQVIGGLSEKKQLADLRAGAQLVVATPGRLEDYLRRRLVSLNTIKIVVLDEADRMLDMGFLPAIRRIMSVVPKKRHTMCFSATLEASVAGLVNEYLKTPERIAFGSVLKPSESVELHAFELTGMEKGDVLRQLLYAEKGQTLVFARTKRGTERLAKQLIRDGFSAAMIHGDRSQSQRSGALAGFQGGKYQVLVATDVAARGIHIDDVAHVINYDLPSIAEDFIHRVGRTGRAGAGGRATTLVAGAEVIELRRMEKILKLRIERKTLDQTKRVHGKSRDTLSSRSITRLPGEVFV
jgi:ATP-dependent RNA helicase RhlE